MQISRTSNLLSKDQADMIYQRLLAQQSSRYIISFSIVPRKHMTKRNWNEEESKLLKWAINEYSGNRNIDPVNFTSADWQNISKLVPGRNET